MTRPDPPYCDNNDCMERYDLIVNECGEPNPLHVKGECWYIPAARNNYHAKVTLADIDYIARVEELAAEARETVLIPFCDKHKIRFVSAMGGRGFYPCDEEVVNAHPSDAKRYEGMEPPEGYEAVRKVLDLETFQGGLFEFMRSYTPKEADDDSPV